MQIHLVIHEFNSKFRDSRFFLRDSIVHAEVYKYNVFVQTLYKGKINKMFEIDICSR